MKPTSKIVLAFGALALGAGIAVAQQDFSRVEIKTTKIAGNVWELEGAGGNILVSSGPDGLLMVDDEFAPLAPKIEDAMKKIGDGALKWVVNTHYHGDHTGSNAVFGAKAPIIAQANVRARLEKGYTVSAFKMTVPPAEKVALPTITYDQQASIWFNGEEVRLTHYPHGHTDTDTVVWFTGSKVVHTGDDFTNGIFPFVDLEHGGDVENLEKNVADILAKLPEGAKVIPGHGPAGDKAALEAFHKMLLASLKAVKDGISKKQTLEKIQAAGLGDEYKSWGAGHVDAPTWLAIVHASVSAKKK